MQAFLRVGFIVVAGVLAITPAFGQTTAIVNPKVVEFDPSADHSAVSASGESMVTRYDIQVFLQGAAQPFAIASLGKPAPETDGKVRVDFSTALPAWPLADGTYEARVVAVGPAGAGLSAPSNAFAFQSAAPVGQLLLLLVVEFPGDVRRRGSAGVTVSASASTCAWTSSSSAAWVTVSPAGGTGSGQRDGDGGGEHRGGEGDHPDNRGSELRGFPGRSGRVHLQPLYPRRSRPGRLLEPAR